jgi:lysyl-tRNA synthetase class 1
MFQSPRKAKRLYFDVIPKAVDEYVKFLDAYDGQEADKQLGNPVWHIHNGQPPAEDMPVSFGLLLNLVGASHADSPAKLWQFISKYAPGATPENHPLLDRLVGFAIAYYQDFVAPNKSFRAPEGKEVQAMEELLAFLEGAAEDTAAEDLQNEIYALGKKYEFDPLRDWFKALYETLLGQSQGPRMGSFIALYGVANSKELIAQALKGELV